jgi:6-phosphogluconolactonase
MKRAYLICLFQSLATTFLLSQSNPAPLLNQSVKVVLPVGTSEADPKAQAMILDRYGGALTAVPGSPIASYGAGPRSVAIDPRGKFVYVANAQSNTVSTYAIDAGTGGLQFVGDVGTGTLPVGVAANFDGKYLNVLSQSSRNVSAYGIDTVTGLLVSLPRSPFAGAGSSNSIVADSLGERLYAGDVTAIIGYRSFDNRGSLGMLPGSPFGGVSGADGLSIDLSESFLYVRRITRGIPFLDFKSTGRAAL